MILSNLKKNYLERKITIKEGEFKYRSMVKTLKQFRLQNKTYAHLIMKKRTSTNN